MNVARIIRCALLLLSLAAGAPTAAQVCNLSAGSSINFLTYNPASGSPAIASTDATLTCTFSGSGGSQKVIAGGVWGNAGCATFPSGQMNLSNGNPQRSVTQTLFGQIPVGQFVSAGVYSENLTLTVNF